MLHLENSKGNEFVIEDVSITAVRIFAFWLYRDELPQTIYINTQEPLAPDLPIIKPWLEAWSVFRHYGLVKAQNLVMRRMCAMMLNKPQPAHFWQDDVDFAQKVGDSRRADMETRNRGQDILTQFANDPTFIKVYQKPDKALEDLPGLKVDPRRLIEWIGLLAAWQRPDDANTSIHAAMNDQQEQWLKTRGNVWLLR